MNHCKYLLQKWMRDGYNEHTKGNQYVVVSMHKTNYVSNAYITHALLCRSTDILKFPVMRTFLIVTQGGNFKQAFLKKTKEQPIFFFQLYFYVRN